MNTTDPPAGMFRQRAFDRQTEQESVDALLRVTAPHEWIAAAGLAVLLLACLAWGLLGRVELQVRVDGVLAKPGERGVIVSPAAGRILDFPAKPGERVPAGAPVATFASSVVDLRLRLAETRESELIRAAERPGDAGPALQAALQAARAERLELAALQQSGSVVAAPRDAEITALLAAAGETVDAGAPIAQVRFDGPGPPEAIAFVDPQQARELQPGMSVRIRYETTPGQPAATLPGELRSLSPPRALPDWLAVTPVGAAQAGGRVGRLARIRLAGSRPPEFTDLAPVRMEIVLGGVAPLRLLAPR